MNAKELIESGLIELYAMGIASENEKMLVKSFVEKEEAVRSEITLVKNSIAAYAAVVNANVPDPRLKNKILNSIKLSQSNIPPKLSALSTVEQWVNYLERNKIERLQILKVYILQNYPVLKNIIPMLFGGKRGDM